MTERLDWKPGTMLYPLPAVLVSCGTTPQQYNLITVSWTGTICTSPPMCYISVRKERHSYDLIRESMEFGINLTTTSMAQATDWCGIRSGSDYEKFEHTGLTAEKARYIQAPLVGESPVSLECAVRDIIPLGSHDMFLAEVINVRVDPRFVDRETGALDLVAANLIVYSHGEYFALGDFIGYFGWSVKKGGGSVERRIHQKRKTHDQN